MPPSHPQNRPQPHSPPPELQPHSPPPEGPFLRLNAATYLVGSGRMGFDLTDPFDCHVYLLDGGEATALIDCGAGYGIDAILANVARLGLPPPSRLLLTHKHGDHAGGAAKLRRRLGRLHIAGSAHTADVLARADEPAAGLDVAKAAGVYPPNYALEPCTVDQIVADGDVVSVGDLRLRAIATPGHCDGHLSLLLEEGGQRALFAGDAVFFGGKVVWQGTHDCSVQGHIASIRRLARESFDAFFPGHLAFSLQNGRRHLEAALERIDRLEVPEGLG